MTTTAPNLIRWGGARPHREPSSPLRRVRDDRRSGRTRRLPHVVHPNRLGATPRPLLITGGRTDSSDAASSAAAAVAMTEHPRVVADG